MIDNIVIACLSLPSSFVLDTIRVRKLAAASNEQALQGWLFASTIPHHTSDADSQHQQPHFFGEMTRGNQRELARAKNQKKQADANKGKRNESNTSIAKRKEADAEALRAKQAAKAAKAAEAAGATN